MFSRTVVIPKPSRPNGAGFAVLSISRSELTAPFLTSSVFFPSWILNVSDALFLNINPLSLKILIDDNAKWLINCEHRYLFVSLINDNKHIVGSITSDILFFAVLGPDNSISFFHKKHFQNLSWKDPFARRQPWMLAKRWSSVRWPILQFEIWLSWAAWWF